MLRLLACLCILAGCAPADQTAFPARALTYLVPWNAGGGTDTVSRTLASVLAEELGRGVTVVNRSGGGGVVGHLALAGARPDGYTIGAVTVEITMMHHVGLTELTHADYTPLALITNNPSAITVRADSPWQTVDDLLRDLRERPGEHFASGTSRGGVWDLARIGFLQRAGLPESAMPWVPSQGAAPGLQELLAGGVDVVTAALAETDALRRAGRVRALAVMASERLAAAPEVPTLRELGFDWTIGGWTVVCGPQDLPADVRAVLVEAIRHAVQSESFRAPLEAAGFNLEYRDGESLQRFIAEQDSTNGALLRSGGLAS